MIQITNTIYLGNYLDSKNIELLKNFKIKAIVCVGKDMIC